MNGRLMHAESVPAVLEDYVHLIDALISGYEATAENRFLVAAEEYAGQCIGKFYDSANGGWLDTETDVLGTRLKQIEDVPHPSPNAQANKQMIRLWLITDKDEYRSCAEQSLAFFSLRASEINVHGGAYFCSLDMWFRKSKVLIEADPGSALSRAARRHAVRTFSTIAYGEDLGRVIICKGTSCSAPVTSPADLDSVSSV